MSSTIFNICDISYSTYDTYFKLDLEIIDNDVDQDDIIWGNGLANFIIQLRLTTGTSFPVSAVNYLNFYYFFGDTAKNIGSALEIDNYRTYDNEVVYSRKVTGYYGRDRHCSCNGYINIDFTTWANNYISDTNIKNLFLIQDNELGFEYRSPLDCRERHLYSSITRQPYLRIGENGNMMASYGQYGLKGTDYFTVDMCVFSYNCNMRAWTLDTDNYDYELCWTLKYPNTIYDNDRNVLIQKGNVVNGDNTFRIDVNSTYPNYTWNSTYRENVTLFLRKYQGDTIISETQEFMTFTRTDLLTYSDITFYDKTHDNDSWLADSDSTTYNNFCNTFDENRDFISNLSTFVFSCHLGVTHLTRDSILSATLYCDNNTYSINFASNTITTNVNIEGDKCYFDFTQDLETFFLPEKMIKSYRLDINIKVGTSTSTTQVFYGYYPILPHFVATPSVRQIYKCDENGIQLPQTDTSNNYFKIVYDIDCYANEFFNTSFNNYRPPSFNIKVEQLPGHNITNYPQVSYTYNNGTKYFESRKSAYIIIPFTLYRDYLYELQFYTPFLDTRTYKNSFSSKKPIMNFKSTGNSMSIGKLSENENYLEIGYNIMTTNDNYTLGLRSDNEKTFDVYNNSYASDILSNNPNITKNKYTDGNNVTRYPHSTTLSIGDSTKSDEFRVIDNLRGRPIMKYTSQDNHTTDNNDTISDNKAFYNHLAFGCGLIFNNQTKGTYDKGLDKDRLTDDYYNFQTGARAYKDGDLYLIFQINSTNVRSIDSGYCIKWGCIVQFYVNIVLNIALGSGDIPDKHMLTIKQPNFRPIIPSGAQGGDWGTMSNGMVDKDGTIFISGASGGMANGSKMTISSTYIARFDQSTDSYFEDCNW